MRNQEVKTIIKLLKRKFPRKIQMFDCQDFAGDYKEVLHKETITVLHAPFYEYVEVLGANEEEYAEIFNACGRH